MKKFTAILISLILILSASFVCTAQNSPKSYMELSATDPWCILSKDMEDTEILKAVSKSAEDINEILESTSSESVIINRETGAQIYLKVRKNDTSHDLWNISDVDDVYLMENLDMIFSDGFSVADFNYKPEDVTINNYSYMKFIMASGSTYQKDVGAHGIVCGGTFVNGNAIVFTMVTKELQPTEEEIKAVENIASGVSFTVIKDKTDEKAQEDNGAGADVFNYILGGFLAIVVIIFCVYMIVRMKNNDQSEETEEIKEDEEKEDSV